MQYEERIVGQSLACILVAIFVSADCFVCIGHHCEQQDNKGKMRQRKLLEIISMQA